MQFCTENTISFSFCHTQKEGRIRCVTLALQNLRQKDCEFEASVEGRKETRKNRKGGEKEGKEGGRKRGGKKGDRKRGKEEREGTKRQKERERRLLQLTIN